jgi:hypothetical protein
MIAEIGGTMKTKLSLAPVFFLACLSVGIPALAQVPDVANSYFNPQSGSVATPTEGAAATNFFRVCPNNDGGSSLPNSARIKVVLKDADGAPIVGLSRFSIYVKFNGGTTVQGFSGDGADSVIANGVVNTNPLCPLVQYLYADASTNDSGVTYITFAGADSTNPGVTVRDSNRKWGHYDFEFPVFANGTQLQGRLTGAGTNGEYILRIKNVDFRGGLTNGNNQGEVVSSLDYNSMSGNLNQPPDDLSYWRDLNGDGSTTIVDLNILTTHRDHDCGNPNSP